MAGRYFGKPFLYVLDALLGTLLALCISNFLSHLDLIKRLLSRFGRHTLPILFIHKPIVQGIAKIFPTFMYSSVFATVLGIVTAIAVSEVVYWLTVKIVPFLYGEKRLVTNAEQ